MSSQKVDVFVAISGDLRIGTNIEVDKDELEQIRHNVNTLSGPDLDEYIHDLIEKHNLDWFRGHVDNLCVEHIVPEDDDA